MSASASNVRGSDIRANAVTALCCAIVGIPEITVVVCACVFVCLSQDLKMNDEHFKGNDFTRAASLTLSAALSRRVVEGEAQGDQGSKLQDDEGDVLQGLPYQLQEGFWLLWRYQVFTK